MPRREMHQLFGVRIVQRSQDDAVHHRETAVLVPMPRPSVTSATAKIDSLKALQECVEKGKALSEVEGRPGLSLSAVRRTSH
jgi:hypothetical protein